MLDRSENSMAMRHAHAEFQSHESTNRIGEHFNSGFDSESFAVSFIIYHYSTPIMMADPSLHIPPQKSKSLRLDADIQCRHTSQSAYNTGDLTLGRVAVLTDLGRYVQVPYDRLVKRAGFAPSQQVLHQTRNNLVQCGILNHDGQWTELTLPPAKSGVHEDATFQPLSTIISTIFANVPGCPVSYLANPSKAPLSERRNTSRPDALVFVGGKAPGGIHWFDIAIPFEFKKNQDSNALMDNEQKIIWSLHNIMREDACRRFAFGITIENTQLRLWLSNRAFLAVSEPINFLEDVDTVISLFYSLGSVTKEALGWDPTIERQPDGNYKIAVKDEWFTTTREIATYGADSMVGRGTRVYEAVDNQGKKVAIKDSWRETDCKSEGDILQEILASCKEKLTVEEMADAEKHFVGVRLYGDVEILGALDETLNLVAGDDDNGAFTWVRIVLEPPPPQALHLPSMGNVPDAGQIFPTTKSGVVRRNDAIPCRVHARYVFSDVGVALKDVNVLADNLGCLYDGLKALHYLHKAGWIHHDFSVGNLIWVVDDNTGIGKLGDFEYAKRIDSNVFHDVRMGTMPFIAVEVEADRYLFNRRPANKKPFCATYPVVTRPPFHMNFLHDIESVWWCFVWIFFYHTDTNNNYSPDALDAQWEQFNKAFPGSVGQISRRDFFTDREGLVEALCTLSVACRPCSSKILYFADELIQYIKQGARPPT